MQSLQSNKSGIMTGKKAIALILMIVGILMMFFIVSNGLSIFQSSKQSSDKQGLSSVECIGYIYEIKAISATPDELQFEFRNTVSSTEDVHNVTVIGADGTAQSFAVNIPVGLSQSIRVPVKVADNFTVYPGNCRAYPSRCNLQGECTRK